MSSAQRRLSVTPASVPLGGSITVRGLDGPDQVLFTYDNRSFDVTAPSAPGALPAEAEATPPPPAGDVAAPTAVVEAGAASRAPAGDGRGKAVLPWVLSGLGIVVLVGAVPVIRRLRAR